MDARACVGVQRVQAQLPSVVGNVTHEIGVHIDQILDPKIMVIDHFRENPALAPLELKVVGLGPLHAKMAQNLVPTLVELPLRSPRSRSISPSPAGAAPFP